MKPWNSRARFSRLAERGVRFIELIDTGSRPNWDSHGDLKEHEDLARNVDQWTNPPPRPSAA
jgi:hypothetical protein